MSKPAKPAKLAPKPQAAQPWSALSKQAKSEKLKALLKDKRERAARRAGAPGTARVADPVARHRISRRRP